jgi:hypothetical protein
VSAKAAGLERAAEAMLRTLGAGKASLLVPQPATATAQTGLGLSTPMVNEVEMEPVLLQTAVNGQTLLALTTRCAVQKAISSAGGIGPKETLQRSMLRSGGRQYRIASVTAKRFGGAELIYELEIDELEIEA